MSKVNMEILQDIMGDHALCGVQREELQKVIDKLTPYKLTYKNGFSHCKCGSEFEREGYHGEEYCTECGQLVWVGGYNGEVEMDNDNIVKFK